MLAVYREPIPSGLTLLLNTHPGRVSSSTLTQTGSTWIIDSSRLLSDVRDLGDLMLLLKQLLLSRVHRSHRRRDNGGRCENR